MECTDEDYFLQSNNIGSAWEEAKVVKIPLQIRLKILEVCSMQEGE